MDRRTSVFWCALVAACGTGEVDLGPLGNVGPHGVGYRTYSVTYSTPITGEERRLFVPVWYPAEAADGERPFYTLKNSDIATVDAPPLELGPRPVFFFSHGHQAYAAAMSHLMEHLASHGFVVVAPTHTGNTTINGDNRETDIYYLRPLDVSRSLDHLLALTSDPLAGRIGDRIAVSGHSFGGYTAFAIAGARYAMDDLEPQCANGTGPSSFCSTMTSTNAELFRSGFRDARFSSVVSFDPGDFALFAGDGIAEIALPTLHMTAEDSGEDLFGAHLRDARSLVLRLAGDHNDFTDACALGFDIACSDVAPADAYFAVHVYTLAFLRATLEDDDTLEGVLDGTQTVSALISR